MSRRRKRGAVLAITAGAIALTACAPSAERTPFADGFAPSTTLIEAEAQRTARRITYRIRSVGCEAIATGSGFAIDENTIVTNRHVVEGAVRIMVSSWDGREVAGVRGTVSQERDLAVIRTDASLPGWGKLGEGSVGDTVWVIGFPEGGEINVSSGKVTAEVSGENLSAEGGPAASEKVWQISAKVVQGNSGGPLVGADGSIIGVVFGYGRESGSGYALQSAGVKALLTADVKPITQTCGL